MLSYFNVAADHTFSANVPKLSQKVLKVDLEMVLALAIIGGDEGMQNPPAN